MSYYNQGPPPGNPYGQSHSPYPPPQGHPPPQQPYGHQQGYNQPPPMNNQGYYGQPPMQQGYGAPPGPPPGQGYGPPQGSPYPPQQGGYGAPPGPPPGQGYGAPPGPPPGQYGAPPGPPPGQYGGQYGAPPPGQYPPPNQYGGGPPAPPSPGYVPNQMGPDMTHAADACRSAMKGFGTNEDQLIRTLAALGPLEINSVKAAFQQKHRRDLMKDVHSETSGYFREGLEAIIRGPLDQDCHTLYESIKGVGTKESAMNEVLLCRSNADLNAIKAHYQHKYKRSVESDVKGDLSAKTERLFDMVMAARRTEESAPIVPQQVDADVSEIYHATEGKTGTDQMTVCSVMTSRSNGQIRAISQAYNHKYRRPLEDVIKSEFSGHMEDALLYILRTCEDPAKRDAMLLEDSMKGMGTKDTALVRRIIMIHWDRQRLQQCKAAYKHFYKQDLAQRIKGETRGDYEKLMVACLGPY